MQSVCLNTKIVRPAGYHDIQIRSVYLPPSLEHFKNDRDRDTFFESRGNQPDFATCTILYSAISLDTYIVTSIMLLSIIRI